MLGQHRSGHCRCRPERRALTWRLKAERRRNRVVKPQLKRHLFPDFCDVADWGDGGRSVRRCRFYAISALRPNRTLRGLLLLQTCPALAEGPALGPSQNRTPFDQGVLILLFKLRVRVRPRLPTRGCASGLKARPPCSPCHHQIALVPPVLQLPPVASHAGRCSNKSEAAMRHVRPHRVR